MFHQPTPSANRHRTALHSEKIPDGPLTDRQRQIADAVRYCRNLADFSALDKRCVTTIEVASIAAGLPREVADKMIVDGLARARAELDKLEGIYRAYGAEAFSPKAEAVPAKAISGSTRHEIVTKAMAWASKRNAVLVRAGDLPLHIDQSGSYVVGNV